MARVFAQEAFKACEKQGISTYEMILLAAHRAKHLRKLPEKDYVLPAEEYKNISVGVTALREIETGNIDMLQVQEDYIKSLQQVSATAEDSEEHIEETPII